MNRQRWKGRATRLHVALYVAAEGVDGLYSDPPWGDGPLSSDESEELAKVLREVGDALYGGDSKLLAKLAKQFKATGAEELRDVDLPESE